MTSKWQVKEINRKHLIRNKLIEVEEVLKQEKKRALNIKTEIK